MATSTSTPEAAGFYLLHFVDQRGQSASYRHARHYLGSAENIARRLHQHRAGSGARLMEVISNAGLEFVLARTWAGGREVERMLKRWHSGVRLCPICQRERRSVEQPRSGRPGTLWEETPEGSN